MLTNSLIESIIAITLEFTFWNIERYHPDAYINTYFKHTLITKTFGINSLPILRGLLWWKKLTRMKQKGLQLHVAFGPLPWTINKEFIRQPGIKVI